VKSGTPIDRAGGLLTELTKAVFERALQTEIPITSVMKPATRPAAATATRATGPRRRQ
jgi:hypothetical protein